MVALLCAGCAGVAPDRALPPATPPDVAGSQIELAVVSILDGDSIVAADGSGDIEMRLAGINAPERDECLGPDARRRLTELAGTTLLVTPRGLDQFGRTLVQAWSLDGEWINLTMVASGSALTLSGAADSVSAAELDALIEAQDSAVEAGIGLWDPGACGARGPRPAVELDLTSPNPAGPDDDVLDQEYVTIINEEPEPLDLSGWTLRDESTANRLVFPPGSVIEAGRSVRVVTGCTAGPDIFAWCAERSIWSNGGDSGYLLDDAGRIVATDRYRP